MSSTPQLPTLLEPDDSKQTQGSEDPKSIKAVSHGLEPTTSASSGIKRDAPEAIEDAKRPRIDDTTSQLDTTVGRNATTDGDGLIVFTDAYAHLTNATGWDGSSEIVCLNPERQRYADLPDVLDALDEPTLNECLTIDATDDESDTDCEFMIDHEVRETHGLSHDTFNEASTYHGRAQSQGRESSRP